MVERSLRESKLASHQRRQTERQLHLIAGEQNAARLWIGNFDLIQSDVRAGEKLEIDGALHGDALAEDVRQLRLDNCALPVPVDIIGPDQRRGQRQNQQESDDSKAGAQD